MENSVYIRLLIVREHTGRITSEEKAVLDRYLAESEEAREMQKEISAIPKEDFVDFTNSIDVDERLLNVLEKESEIKRNRYKVLVRIMSSVAAAAFIAWGVFSFIDTPSKSITADKMASGNTATLTLANGKVINLNDSGYQQLHTGNTSINNNNRLLKFGQAAGAQGEGIGWNTLTVPKKLDYQVELSDGTTVWLNSTTKLRFPFTFPNGNREVYLDAGEAYFKIAQNSNQPFIVHTNQGDVQVLGTEFNINAYTPNQLVTSLVNGKVAVKAGIDRKELLPGSEAIVEGGKAILVQDFDPSIALSWRQGLHYFNDAPITAVATMLERWFDTPLIIDNAQLSNMPFRGRIYRHKPLQDFMDQMNLTGDITFYWKDGKLHCK